MEFAALVLAVLVLLILVQMWSLHREREAAIAAQLRVQTLLADQENLLRELKMTSKSLFRAKTLSGAIETIDAIQKGIQGRGDANRDQAFDYLSSATLEIKRAKARL
jgi:hypothetical protein